MTQKERVLRMLQQAGEQGVRSDRFYREFNGRGVARIYDLRKEGYEIEDRREGKYKRYFLTRMSAGKTSEDAAGLDSAELPVSPAPAGAHSGEEQRGAAALATAAAWAETPENVSGSREGVNPSVARGGSNPHAAPVRSVPSFFDADDCLDWNAA